MTRAMVRAAAGLLALSAAACGGSDEASTTAQASEPIAVQTAVASMRPLAERLEAGGVVTAGTSATLSSRVLATVTDVRARAGTRVRAGQVLVVLDDRDLAAQASQADAAASAAEQALSAAKAEQAASDADHKLAAAWQGRIASLHGRNSATAQELDEADARLASAAARVEGTRLRIAQAEASLAAARAAAEGAGTLRTFAVLRAPFDGLVTETFTDPGNMAAPGTPLLRLESAGAQRVEATVDEARAPWVNVGDRVEVLFESASRGEDARTVAGTVVEIARAVAAGERAFTVKVSLPREPALRSGSFARLRFRGAARDALSVPADAIRRQGQVSTVFVVDGDVARLRLLQTGAAAGEDVEVLAGLDAGEIVVRSPPPQLADGRRVTTRRANTAGSGA